LDHPLSEIARAMDALKNGARPSTDADQGATKTPVARPDFHREDRKGVPEVILAEGKAPEHVVQIARAFVARRGRAILSRVSHDVLDLVRREFSDLTIVEYPIARLVVLRAADLKLPETGGRVGIITAGTSDIPAAEEAKGILVEMGCSVHEVFDVGVAGIHRLFEPLHEMMTSGVDVIIVAAGMDGALPSVVSGLVDVPVIGLPTSTGYGMGGKGVGALTTMLQTCSPGLAVVNIDNGVGAAATAGMIANRVASARRGGQSDRVLTSDTHPLATS
jgi:pyridinium-3,5-biscarboxylic acid mononucleotide synthase